MFRWNNVFRIRLREKMLSLSEDDGADFLGDALALSRNDPSPYVFLWVACFVASVFFNFNGLIYWSLIIFVGLIGHMVIVLFNFYVLLRDFKQKWYNKQ